MHGVESRVPADVSVAVKRPGIHRTTAKPRTTVSATSRFLRRVMRGEASRNEARDTGMAVVLVLLLLGIFRGGDAYVVAAAVVHVANMIAPQAFKPIAVIWFGLSHVLGAVASRVMLSIIFFVVVTPIGLLRRWSGADPLLLREFKRGSGSVMRHRDHTFAGRDLEQPF